MAHVSRCAPLHAACGVALNIEEMGMSKRGRKKRDRKKKGANHGKRPNS